MKVHKFDIMPSLLVVGVIVIKAIKLYLHYMLITEPSPNKHHHKWCPSNPFYHFQTHTGDASFQQT